MGRKPKLSWKQGQYFVQKIIGSRFNLQKKRIQYKVKWVGYPYDQCTWEPNQNLKNDKTWKKIGKGTDKKNIQRKNQKQEESQSKKQLQNNKIGAKQETRQKRRRNIRYKSKLIKNINSKNNFSNQLKNTENEKQITKNLSSNINSAQRINVKNQFSKNQKQFQQKKSKPFGNSDKFCQNPKGNQFYFDEKSQNSAEKSFQILGMARNKMDFLFHICQNRVQKWVNRSQIIDKRARQICEFYQQNLVFLKEKSQNGIMN